MTPELAGVTIGAATLATTPALLWSVHRCSSAGRQSTTPVVGGTTLLVGAVLAMASDTALSGVLLAVGLVGTAAALVDLHEGRLPNPLTGTLAAAVAAAVLVGGNGAAIMRAVVAAIMCAVVAVGVKAAWPGALGWGDVKLLPSLAAALASVGSLTVYRGLLWSTVLLAVTVVVWRATDVTRGATVPYGPGLVIGAWAALLAAG
jgi:leader peptidase (prepilin peptidase) / N-methyltransferase